MTFRKVQMSRTIRSSLEIPRSRIRWVLRPLVRSIIVQIPVAMSICTPLLMQEAGGKQMKTWKAKAVLSGLRLFAAPPTTMMIARSAAWERGSSERFQGAEHLLQRILIARDDAMGPGHCQRPTP